MNELERYQIELAKKVKLEDYLKVEDVEYVAGVDQAFVDDNVISASVILKFPELELIKSSVEIEKTDFPYIPGFLMFREGKSAINCLKKVVSGFNNIVILVDGSGIAHPRKCGLATYIALSLKMPAIGITKRKLFGEVVIPQRVMEHKPIYSDSEIIGYALKTCKRCNPIFISPGSYITPKTALRMVEMCLKGYKLPEPIRLAHNLANETKRNFRIS